MCRGEVRPDSWDSMDDSSCWPDVGRPLAQLLEHDGCDIIPVGPRLVLKGGIDVFKGRNVELKGRSVVLLS